MNVGRRDVTLLAAGQAISVAGDSAALVALLLRMRPYGGGWVAALLAAELVPYIVCGPAAGRIVDAFETRRVLLIALLGQAVAAVPLALYTSPAATVTAFAVLSAMSTLVRPATTTLVPAVMGPEGSAGGYALLATGAGLGFIAGPVVGGALTAVVGTDRTLLLDAVTFLALGGFVALTRVRRAPAVRNEMSRTHALTGFGLLWQSPLLRAAFIVTTLTTSCAVVDNVAAPFRFINQLGTGAFGFGLYSSVWGAGSLLGMQVLPRLDPTRHPLALAAGNLLTGAGIAAIGLLPNLPLVLVAAGVGGFGNGLIIVAQNALVAAHTPPNQHGQAFAAAGATNQAALGVGIAAGAPLVTALGAGHAMGLAGGLAAMAALAGLARSLRTTPPSTRQPANRSDPETNPTA